jgi:hypothetical protein
VAAIHVADVRGDPCGAVQRTAPQDGSFLNLEGEGKGTTILRNARNRLTSDTVS